MKKFDSCTYFNINDVSITGRLIRLDNTIDTILSKHLYPKDVSGILAESTALACLLSSSIKYDGLFTLQIQTDGAVSLVVVDVTTDGKIRACARFDKEKIEKIRNPNEKFKLQDHETLEAPHWLGKGHLAFTVDQGKSTDLYQGIVELNGKDLSECALKYFKQSEQIETYLKLYITYDNGWKSAGILLQKLPEHKDVEDKWEEAVVFAQSLAKEEIFNDDLSSIEILNRLYHNNDLRVSQTKEYAFSCRCSREKLQETLSTISGEELYKMTENGKITAQCNFCSELYSFDKGELIKH